MKNEVIGQVSGGELKGEKPAARKSEAGGVKLTAEKMDTHTIMMEKSKQDMAYSSEVTEGSRWGDSAGILVVPSDKFV